MSLDLHRYLVLHIPGGGLVQVKLEDEGVIVDVFVGDGEPVATAAKEYAEFGVTMTPFEDGPA